MAARLLDRAARRFRSLARALFPARTRLIGWRGPRVAGLGLALLTLVATQIAAAQTIYTVQTTNTNMTGVTNFANCFRQRILSFSVTEDFVIDDVDLGVFMEHSQRGAMRVTLQAPDGTRVQLIDGGDTSITGEHLNVLLDDGASQTVNTDDATADHPLTAPLPYAFTFKPNSALAAFNGKSSAGTWLMELCNVPSGGGAVFYRADLFLSSYPADYVDLSLVYEVSDASPTHGAEITYDMSVTNSAAAISTATGVMVSAPMPAGAVYAGSTGDGTYDAASGIWTVGSIAPATTRTLTITALVDATSRAVVASTAELIAADPIDLDSTPGNLDPAEDDQATASFTVSGSGAGTPPTLTCTAGTTQLDWDSGSHDWVAGTTDNALAVPGLGSVAFSLSNPGLWVHNFGYGGQSPTVHDAVNGGYTGQKALIEYVNLPNKTAVATTVISLPDFTQGAQFRIFDVDYEGDAFQRYADHVTVEGRYGGATVYPTLTNGLSNHVIGNEAFGDGTSDAGSANGTIVVTFADPIDQIVIHYGNHSAAPGDPGLQEIALGDLTFCKPYAAISLTTVSTVKSDPVNAATEPKAIPGAEIEYLVSVANAGFSPTDTDSVVITDGAPPGTKICFDTAASGEPIVFLDGTPPSGLTYAYAGLTNATDSLFFSSDGGASWTYQPTADADGCDAGITHFQLRPSGTLAAGGSFTLRASFRIE